jgi:hypothetical protein
VLVALVLVCGLARFVPSGFLPAAQRLTGDFSAAFPSGALAWLRPDFPRTNVIGAATGMWNYGPVMHAVTLPLFLAPTWSAVAPLWAIMNLLIVVACFVTLIRLVPRRVALTPESMTLLAALWLLFQPLATCFAQGNIEIAELLMLVLAFRLIASDRFNAAAVWIGLAVMTKFLPAGFIGWLLLKRRWRAAAVAGATVAVIAALTAVTLKWHRSVTLTESMAIATSDRLAGFQEAGVASIFFHATAVFDRATVTLLWFPAERVHVATVAGRIASVALVAAFSLLFARRRRDRLPDELGALCLLMLLVAPWTHDYYHIFALVPLTLFGAEALATRDRPALIACAVAYCLISPPVPFVWIDRTHLFPYRFLYWIATHDIRTAGTLLLLTSLAARLLSRPEA